MSRPDIRSRLICKICDIITESDCGCKCPDPDGGNIETIEECPYIPKIKPKLQRLINREVKKRIAVAVAKMEARLQ